MVHDSGKFGLMSVVAFDDDVRRWARRLEEREATRSSTPLPIARTAVARRVGVAAGTLESIRRGRLKGVRTWIADRIKMAFVRELEAEIAALSHELDLLRQGGVDPRSDQIGEVEAHLAAARRLLRGST